MSTALLTSCSIVSAADPTPIPHNLPIALSFKQTNNEAHSKTIGDAARANLGNGLGVLEKQLSNRTFSDISSDYWAHDYIQKLAEKNIISGLPDGTFKPEAPVTRAEFAAILTQAFPRSVTGIPQPFNDVPTDHWAAEAIQFARLAGFLSGYPDNTFQPQQPLSRVQGMVALASGLDYSQRNFPGSDADAVYTDFGAVPPYAVRQVWRSTELGVAVSYPNPEQLNPNQMASRADVAALVYQALVQAGQAEPLPSAPYAVPAAPPKWPQAPSTVIAASPGARLSGKLSLSGLGEHVMMADGSKLQIWEVRSGNPLSAIASGSGVRFKSAAISDDGTQVAAIVQPGSTQALQLQLWETGTGEQIWTQPMSHPSQTPAVGIVPTDASSEIIAFAPKSTVLLTQVVTAGEVSLQLYDSRSGEKLRRLDPRFARGLSAFSFSSDGKLLAGASHGQSRPTDSVIDVWRLSDGVRVRSLFPIEDNLFRLGDIAFNASGNLTVMSKEDFGYAVYADVWSVDSGRRLERHPWAVDRQTYVRILSPEANYYFTSSEIDGTYMNNLNTGRKTTLEHYVSEAVFNREGTRLAILGRSDIQIFDTIE